MPTPAKLATDKKVAVLIAEGLEEVEALAVVDVLFRAGIPTELIAVGDRLTVTSSHQVVITCEALLEEVNLADYDLVFLPGGIPGTPNLKAVPAITAEVTARMGQGRPVAAICAAPSILAELGLLEGRAATANPNFMELLATRGARTSEAAVVVDDQLLTSRGMGTAIELGLEIVRHYLGDDAVEAVKRGIVYQH
ncbi:4-methyl-5(b-hydroxyethyl)-thiazole monophosphate biosynthesis [Actinomyces ruminicola]|uniref:4-methyl-5(B-hydroxyethyl)-thiazole monophosphate biosynthesis n=1 Tax=Actinomyces ruminicola TaxID=332524 RepID=A0A1G9ZXK6_9ACTO|nr:DJ-1 family glyoxalase III [Actinomyces ruminicola]SDN25855.1 4-methyl-5(b-hydroxyethyl)-thiazole monophosphate biosynthesis [Actinomyces ruminicola]